MYRKENQMQKAALTRTPIYSSAPLGTYSPSGSAAPSPILGNASLATTATAGTAGPASWDSLRKEVRQVEIEIESKLTALSKSAVQTGNGESGAGVGQDSSSSSNTGATASPEELETNIEVLLERVRLVVDKLPITWCSVLSAYNSRNTCTNTAVHHWTMERYIVT